MAGRLAVGFMSKVLAITAVLPVKLQRRVCCRSSHAVVHARRWHVTYITDDIHGAAQPPPFDSDDYCA
jgi:hypothetical protein